MISGYLMRFLFYLVSFNPAIGREELRRSREDLRRDLDHLNSVLDNLDELGDIMVLMLTTQDSIEVYPYSYPLLHNTTTTFPYTGKGRSVIRRPIPSSINIGTLARTLFGLSNGI